MSEKTIFLSLRIGTNMQHKIYLLIALCLPVSIQGMEEQPSIAESFPDELILKIASEIEGKDFTDTIKAIKRLGLVSKRWHSVIQDGHLYKAIINNYKEKEANNNLSDIVSSENEYFLFDIKRFYNEFVEAAALGYVQLIKLVLAHDPAFMNKSAVTSNPEAQNALDLALIAAAEHNQIEIAKCLIAAGATANRQDQQFRTALLAALESGYHDMALLILEKCGNLNMRVRDQAGETAIEKATKNNDIELVKLLLARGADAQNVSFKFSENPPKSALILAGELGYQDLEDILIAAKPPVYVKFIHNFTTRRFTITVLSPQGDVKRCFEVGHSEEEIAALPHQNERILAMPPRQLVDINLICDQNNRYDSIVITGEGIRGNSWNYSPSGSTNLLYLGISIVTADNSTAISKVSADDQRDFYDN
jgi:hypothetical protein